MVVNDPKSGASATIDSTKKIISLTDKDGKKVWSVNVIEEMGQPPFVGKPEIRYVSFSNSNLTAIVGKHTFISIDTRTGKVTVQGSD